MTGHRPIGKVCRIANSLCKGCSGVKAGAKAGKISTSASNENINCQKFCFICFGLGFCFWLFLLVSPFFGCSFRGKWPLDQLFLHLWNGFRIFFVESDLDFYKKKSRSYETASRHILACCYQLWLAFYVFSSCFMDFFGCPFSYKKLNFP